jgi:DNA-binding MarR family transcriptional regulator
MAYVDVFLDMMDAYRKEFGDAFPSADPGSVVLVLRECNRPVPKSQTQIVQVTGMSQSNVAKLMKKMISRGWLEITKPDPNTAVKTVKISFSGFGMLDSFEKACRRAAKNASKAKASGF